MHLGNCVSSLGFRQYHCEVDESFLFGFYGGNLWCLSGKDSFLCIWIMKPFVLGLNTSLEVLCRDIGNKRRTFSGATYRSAKLSRSSSMTFKAFLTSGWMPRERRLLAGNCRCFFTSLPGNRTWCNVKRSLRDGPHEGKRIPGSQQAVLDYVYDAA